MSDVGGDSDWEYADDQYDWLYVEEYYDEADQLAEQTCPSPAFNNGHEHGEYDPYDYWEDLTYLSDGVYDEDTKTPKKPSRSNGGEMKEITGAQRSTKRKAESGGQQRSVKRRKTLGKGKINGGVLRSEGPTEPPPVLWKTADHQEDVTTGSKADSRSSEQAVSILKDWKERFKDDREPLPETELDAHLPTPSEPNSGGVAFDLNNIQSIAELLSGDSIEELKNILKARGLDPEAVEVVLQDLIAGNEPGFDDDEADDEADDEDIVTGDQDHNDDDNANIVDPLIDEEQLKDVSKTSQIPHPVDVPSAHTANPTSLNLAKSAMEPVDSKSLKRKRTEAEDDIENNPSQSPKKLEKSEETARKALATLFPIVSLAEPRSHDPLSVSKPKLPPIGLFQTRANPQRQNPSRPNSMERTNLPPMGLFQTRIGVQKQTLSEDNSGAVVREVLPPMGLFHTRTAVQRQGRNTSKPGAQVRAALPPTGLFQTRTGVQIHDPAMIRPSAAASPLHTDSQYTEEQKSDESVLQPLPPSYGVRVRLNDQPGVNSAIGSEVARMSPTRGVVESSTFGLSLTMEPSMNLRSFISPRQAPAQSKSHHSPTTIPITPYAVVLSRLRQQQRVIPNIPSAVALRLPSVQSSLQTAENSREQGVTMVQTRDNPHATIRNPFIHPWSSFWSNVDQPQMPDSNLAQVDERSAAILAKSSLDLLGSFQTIENNHRQAAGLLPVRSNSCGHAPSTLDLDSAEPTVAMSPAFDLRKRGFQTIEDAHRQAALTGIKLQPYPPEAVNLVL